MSFDICKTCRDARTKLMASRIEIEYTNGSVVVVDPTKDPNLDEAYLEEATKAVGDMLSLMGIKEDETKCLNCGGDL